MVVLNSEILVNKNKMIGSIRDIMEQVLHKYFDEEMLVDNVEKKRKILQEVINEKLCRIKDKHFWHINCSEEVCTHFFKRGKKEGYMCHKKIKTNIEGDKKDFLCCTHSKLHIPKTCKKKITKPIEKKIHDVKKIIKIREKVEKKRRKIYICNSGNLNLSKILSELLN